MTTEYAEQEVLDSMPAIQQQGGGLVAQDNPYMRMAEMAMTTGKVEQLDKLLDLQLRWDAEQQRKAFVSAMSDFKAEAGGITIAKSKNVSFSGTNYNHAELHDITRALVPIMAKHGLSHRWVTTQADRMITVECVVSHRDGHSERVSMSAPPDDSGKKNTIQQIASSVTYLSRYTLLAATGVATGGELDDDARIYGQEAPAQVEFITESQEIVLRDLIAEYITNEESFFKWIRSARDCQHVEKLSDIPANRFDAIHSRLNEIRKNKAAQA